MAAKNTLSDKTIDGEINTKSPTLPPAEKAIDPSPTGQENLSERDEVTGEQSVEAQADRVVEEVFGSEENALGVAEIISRFTVSYEKHKHEKPLNEWLAEELKKYPGAWKDAAEAEAAAESIIEAIQATNDAKQSLHQHLNKGKSRESWLAKRLEQGATLAGVTDVAAYASSIDAALADSTRRMQGAVMTQSGAINRLPNLDGFIAEHHHVNTFNLDAVAKGSGYRARVLEPQPGQAYGKNGLDVGIYDPAGKLVRRYQSKYGADADATQRLLDAGDYRGQRKLVPTDQVDQVQGSTDAIEIDGVSSKPLTKEQAKAVQQDAQLRAEIKAYEWNDVTRIEVSKRIGKQALGAAAFVAAFQGARIAGRRMWNKLVGKENPPASEDIMEFFESSLESGAHVGIVVAISGAVTVAAKNGLLGAALKGTPAGRIADVVYVGIENAKVIYKFFKGEITATEAIDAMGNVTCSAIGGLMGAGKGAFIGAQVGMLAGPVGSAVGGFVGAVVGGMAGSKVGQAVYEGGKALAKTAAKVGEALWEGVKESTKAVARVLSPLNLIS